MVKCTKRLDNHKTTVTMLSCNIDNIIKSGTLTEIHVFAIVKKNTKKILLGLQTNELSSTSSKLVRHQSKPGWVIILVRYVKPPKSKEKSCFSTLLKLSTHIHKPMAYQGPSVLKHMKTSTRC